MTITRARKTGFLVVLVLTLATMSMLFNASAYAESLPSTLATVNTEDSTVSTLLHMREEEKLAHDVYVTLYDIWGLQIFNNIAQAESQHMNSVLSLLELRSIADPVGDNALGQFTDPELQTLYTALVTQGSQSRTDALIVGATIEDLDIADLQDCLSQPLDADIQMVFENLMRGSENHLRAFVRNVERTGESYEPQYISAMSYAAIIGSTDAGAGNSVIGRGRRSNSNLTDNTTRNDNTASSRGRSGRNR